MEHIPLQTALAIQENAKAQQLQARLELARMRERQDTEMLETAGKVAVVVVGVVIAAGILGALFSD